MCIIAATCFAGEKAVLVLLLRVRMSSLPVGWRVDLVDTVREQPGHTPVPAAAAGAALLLLLLLPPPTMGSSAGPRRLLLVPVTVPPG